ncbi:class I SAM-dependent methyltransferase [Paralimibaculum aggregatum]|uniref:Class I SAM-dependent methyltransferase n=1 Tax=Paralimibaculum aggregatum TaxID=3036245 RepID=A0ABQ6LPL8_9RHOB|nr:class I SAM-dependent methyltransferase [Limibaculum sp. NKW23]GMG84414.1 class I SAM-dependent methyltransferase [Limibaculum sp. NKW23]
MTEIEETVARHYGASGLLARIEAGLAAAGADPAAPTPEDLKPVDEFHIGGAEATRAVLGGLDIAAGAEALDIGCGIGGTARHLAGRHGCRVLGVDLTPEFVATAAALTRRVGLDAACRFAVGSARALPAADASHDLALLFHVGMNVPDKPGLFAEAARVLRPGGRFAVYDVMAVGAGQIAYPVPWAAAAESSFIAAPEAYRAAAAAAGLALEAEHDRRDDALDFFARLRTRIAETGPPPLGIHLLMGETAGQKIANMIANIEAGRIAPVEMLFRKP